MLSRNYLPHLVQCEVSHAEGHLDANAKRSEDGRVLLQVVNPSEKAVGAEIHLAGLVPSRPQAQVTELSGPLEAVNTASTPNAIVPRQSEWEHRMADGNTRCTFPPRSFTVIRFE